MRVRGPGYWIGAGFGALGLIGIFVWVSMVSARPGNQVVVPDQAAGAAAENGLGPSQNRSKAEQQQDTPQPVGFDTALTRLRSRSVAGSDTAREQAADASALIETDDENESSSRILRVEPGGAASEAKRSDDSPAAGGDAGDKDPGTATPTAEPSAGATADPGRLNAGGKWDKRGSVNDSDQSASGRSGPTSKPKADNDGDAPSTTAKSRQPSTTATTAKPTTQNTVRETTTIKAPTTSTTASTTTRPATTAKPTTTRTPTTAASSGGGGNQALEQRVIELTNDARRQAGCPALAHNDKLRLAAHLHSKDMSDNDYFSHTGLDGSSPWERIARQGYSGGAAENIAWGYRTPEAVVEGWMNSSGHRANILNCSLTEIGVGFHDYYWTQNFGIPR
jgi:uncharacterized protein YkwD